MEVLLQHLSLPSSIRQLHLRYSSLLFLLIPVSYHCSFLSCTFFDSSTPLLIPSLIHLFFIPHFRLSSFTSTASKCSSLVFPTYEDTGSLGSPPHQVAYPPGPMVQSWVTACRFLTGNMEAELKPITFSSPLLFRVFLSFLFS